MAEILDHGQNHAEWKAPVVVSVITNPVNGIEETVLHLNVRIPGTYRTPLGAITLEEVILDGHEEVFSNNIDGRYGRVVVDLSYFQLITYYGVPRQEVSIHRKGIGSKVINETSRLWVDFGERLAPRTGYEETAERWSPVKRSQ